MMFNALNSHRDRKAGAALMVISARAYITMLSLSPGDQRLWKCLLSRLLKNSGLDAHRRTWFIAPTV